MRQAAFWMLLLSVLPAGCNLSRAVLDGHDVLDDGLANIRTGIDEYHADDAERMAGVRRQLTGAFVADVLAAADDEAAVTATTEKFLALLEAAEAAENVEETRYRNLLGTLRAMAEVNAALRDLGQIRLGWKRQAVEYADRLREKLEARHGNGN